jgi:hypothetical protein
MAQHDFISQYAAALLAGDSGAHIISRALWSGLTLEEVDAMIDVAEAVAAG